MLPCCALLLTLGLGGLLLTPAAPFNPATTPTLTSPSPNTNSSVDNATTTQQKTSPSSLSSPIPPTHSSSPPSASSDAAGPAPEGVPGADENSRLWDGIGMGSGVTAAVMVMVMVVVVVVVWRRGWNLPCGSRVAATPAEAATGAAATGAAAATAEADNCYDGLVPQSAGMSAQGEVYEPFSDTEEKGEVYEPFTGDAEEKGEVYENPAFLPATTDTQEEKKKEEEEEKTAAIAAVPRLGDVEESVDSGGDVYINYTPLPPRRPPPIGHPPLPSHAPPSRTLSPPPRAAVRPVPAGKEEDVYIDMAGFKSDLPPVKVKL